MNKYYNFLIRAFPLCLAQWWLFYSRNMSPWS